VADLRLSIFVTESKPFRERETAFIVFTNRPWRLIEYISMNLETNYASERDDQRLKAQRDWHTASLAFSSRRPIALQHM